MKKRTVVAYHANCQDGFGGAFAAWKILGDSAEYRPLKHGLSPPTDLAGADVYFIDFSYPKEVLEKIEREANSFVILDHHISAKDSVESMKNYVFDNDHSGAVLSWQYFHKDIATPAFLAYVEDIDLYRKSLPHYEEVASYLSALPMEFSAWEKTLQDFENPDAFGKIIEKGKIINSYITHILNVNLPDAEEVEFEGHRILATNVTRLFHSAMGNLLAKKQPPFAITYYRGDGLWKFSLRGDGSIDCSAIAKKYGGGGHHNAAAFSLPFGATFPFTLVSKS